MREIETLMNRAKKTLTSAELDNNQSTDKELLLIKKIELRPALPFFGGLNCL